MGLATWGAISGPGLRGHLPGTGAGVGVGGGVLGLRGAVLLLLLVVWGGQQEGGSRLGIRRVTCWRRIAAARAHGAPARLTRQVRLPAHGRLAGGPPRWARGPEPPLPSAAAAATAELG